MNKTILLLLSTLLLFGAEVFAQKYANNQLNIGVGAHAYSMGNAVVASVDNTTAGYYNPAGLALIDVNFQPAIMHAELFAGVAKLDYLSVAAPISDGTRTVGLSIIRNGVDNIPNTLFAVDATGVFHPDQVEFFSSADYAILLSYAQPRFLRDGLRAGINAKIIYRTAGDFTNAYGFGIDLGAQYDLDDLTIGVMLKDITTTFTAWNFNFTDEEKEVFASTGNDIPVRSTEFAYPAINLGAAYKLYFGGRFTLLSELDVDLTTDGRRNVLISGPISINPHLGVELNYDQFLFVRGGLNNMQKATNALGNERFFVQPNLGVGVKVADLTIDYALTRFGDFNDGVFSHVFSLMFDVRSKNSPEINN